MKAKKVSKPRKVRAKLPDLYECIRFEISRMNATYRGFRPSQNI